jgi:hypothetical protein
LAIQFPLLALAAALILFVGAMVLTLLDRIRTDLRGVRCELLRARLARREGANNASG